MQHSWSTHLRSRAGPQFFDSLVNRFAATHADQATRDSQSLSLGHLDGARVGGRDVDEDVLARITMPGIRKQRRANLLGGDAGADLQRARSGAGGEEALDPAIDF